MPHIDNTKSPAEVAYGEGQPLALGDDGDYEVKQNPLTGRLEITDTQSGETAYVDPDRSGQLGGDGVFIRSLAQGKPLADDGTLYDTVQAAENAASSWLFIPPGTFNERVSINTEGLWIQGAGYQSVINGGDADTLLISAENVTVNNLSVTNTSGTGEDDNTIECRGDGATIKNITIEDSDRYFLRNYADDVTIANVYGDTCGHIGIYTTGARTIVSGCHSINAGDQGLRMQGPDGIAVSNVVRNNGSRQGVIVDSNDNIILGNRVHNAADDGINVTGNDNILGNNRVSGSGASDINDQGTNTLLDANVTGAAN